MGAMAQPTHSAWRQLAPLPGLASATPVIAWIAPAARGRGLAARALLAAADFVFTEWAGNRLLLFHAVPNQASCRVAVKAGMTLEGHLRQSYKYGDGTVYDEHLHAILASDLAR